MVTSSSEKNKEIRKVINQYINGNLTHSEIKTLWDDILNDPK